MDAPQPPALTLTGMAHDGRHASTPTTSQRVSRPQEHATLPAGEPSQDGLALHERATGRGEQWPCEHATRRLSF